jgi:aspartyl protease family protein
MSKNMLIAATIWLALASGIYYLADGILNPNKVSVLGESRSVVLQRGLDGHYRAESLINGTKVDVLVDTGATGVAISQKIADALNLKSHDAIRTTTANGDSVAYLMRLATVKLGGVEAKNVAATIAPGLDGDVLLGMSFLGRMDVRLFNNEMTIKQVER